IYWDGNPNGDTSGTWKTTSTSNINNQWYNYSKKYWANAVTVTPASLSTYQNTTDVTVSESHILGYWVYIPRYRYQIQRYSALGDPPIEKPMAFNIQFENKNTPNYQKAIPEQNNDWATHPAFSFGDEDDPTPTELNGLWVAKFEATGTATAPTVKPNTTALTYQTIGAQFGTSINISQNPDGAAGGNTITAQNAGQNTHNLTGRTQSRMLRNTDWGAVAYLATSSYGRNATEVWTNNNSSNITGCAGESVSATSTSSCNQYNTPIGVYASTTDNIYGIYGMSGGPFEYTMSNRGAISDTSYMTTMPQTRYLNTYYVGPFGIKPSTSSSSNEYFYNYDVCTFQICGGQANYETTVAQSVSELSQSWLSDYAQFTISQFPWTCRGGGFNGFTFNGLFASRYEEGSAANTSFRPLLSEF
ncbi:MAG: hypothetical protein LBL08_02245, partial [Candidatus Nomurabacteria bacterium]|nr:hypothetical protein [Candidatus Nomurabacteria bacterium]